MNNLIYYIYREFGVIENLRIILLSSMLIFCVIFLIATSGE